MILRSASSPALNPRAAQKPSVPLGKSSTRTVTARPVSASPVGGKILMPRASSDGNLKKMRGVPVPERKTTGVHFEMASSNVLEESGFGGGRGSIGGGAAGAGGGGGGEEESVDAYYEEMIRRYPGDALLLANYARFLKEVKGDERRAEEYCERAILSEKSKDGNLLTMYGDLIWKNHKDSVRAQSYFDQAVRSSPHDCYVLASYARFLWDAEDDDDDNGDKDDEEEEEIKYQTNISPSNASQQDCLKHHPTKTPSCFMESEAVGFSGQILKPLIRRNLETPFSPWRKKMEISQSEEEVFSGLDTLGIYREFLPQRTY